VSSPLLHNSTSSFVFFLNPEIGFLTGGGARGGAEEEKEEKEQEEEVGLFSIHLHYTITM